MVEKCLIMATLNRPSNASKSIISDLLNSDNENSDSECVVGSILDEIFDLWFCSFTTSLVET